MQRELGDVNVLHDTGQELVTSTNTKDRETWNGIEAAWTVWSLFSHPQKVTERRIDS